MEPTIPSFGPREIIVLAITLAAILAFLSASTRLIFTKKSEQVTGGYSSGDGGLNFKTRNLAVVTLLISSILLAFIANYALAQTKQQWVYLGTGFNKEAWNFENVNGSKNIVANDIVRALKNNINIRSNHFNNTTGTWLGRLGSPEPPIIGSINAGECATVLGFESVGFNRVWMRIKPSACK